MRSLTRSWVLVLAVSLLSSPPVTALYAAPPVRLQVPFFPDKTDQCGPSTLAGVLSFWGKTTDPKNLRQEMYTAKLRGTLPMDLMFAAKERGLKVQAVEGTIDQIKEELRAGRPVLAMLNLGTSFAPIGHYVTVTGFDDARGGLFMHSGKKENTFMSYKGFEKKWKKTDHWALLTQLPA